MDTEALTSLTDKFIKDLERIGDGRSVAKIMKYQQALATDLMDLLITPQAEIKNIRHILDFVPTVCLPSSACQEIAKGLSAVLHRKHLSIRAIPPDYQNLLLHNYQSEFAKIPCTLYNEMPFYPLPTIGDLLDAAEKNEAVRALIAAELSVAVSVRDACYAGARLPDTVSDPLPSPVKRTKEMPSEITTTEVPSEDPATEVPSEDSTMEETMYKDIVLRIMVAAVVLACMSFSWWWPGALISVSFAGIGVFLWLDNQYRRARTMLERSILVSLITAAIDFLF